MHSPVETLDLKDITRTGRLMAQFIASLDENFLTTMTGMISRSKPPVGAYLPNVFRASRHSDGMPCPVYPLIFSS